MCILNDPRRSMKKLNYTANNLKTTSAKKVLLLFQCLTRSKYKAFTLSIFKYGINEYTYGPNWYFLCHFFTGFIVLRIGIL